MFIGLRRCDSWPWWFNGSFWLPASYGHFCKCLYTYFYQVSVFTIIGRLWRVRFCVGKKFSKNSCWASSLLIFQCIVELHFRVPNPSKLLQQILWLPADERLFIFRSLHEHLIREGLLNVWFELCAGVGLPGLGFANARRLNRRCSLLAC